MIGNDGLPVNSARFTYHSYAMSEPIQFDGEDDFRLTGTRFPLQPAFPGPAASGGWAGESGDR